MDGGLVWVIGFVALAVLGWVILRPRGGGASAAQVREAVDAGGLLLDVRTPAEFAGGHVDGARNVPVDSLQGVVDQLDRDRPVVVYCRSGARSARASRILHAAGFEQVVDGRTVEAVRDAVSR